jgi:hypothetical protein
MKKFKNILEYKNYININDLFEDLKYLRLDMHENGYIVGVWLDKWMNDKIIDIIIERKDNKMFTLNEQVIDFILRVNHYLYDMGFIYRKYSYNFYSKYEKKEYITKFNITPNEELIDENGVLLSETSGVNMEKIKLEFKLK